MGNLIVGQAASVSKVILSQAGSLRYNNSQAGSLRLMSLSKGIIITNQIKSSGRDERVRISLPVIIADLRHSTSLHFVNPYKFFTYLSKPVLLNLLTLSSQYEKDIK